MKNAIYNLALITFFLFFSACSSGPDGIYKKGSSSNYSYISFSPPNKHHDGYITWIGNKNGRTTSCATRGSYIYNAENKTITVSGLYNSNCPGQSDLNGIWKYEVSYVVNPFGRKYHKD